MFCSYSVLRYIYIEVVGAANFCKEPANENPSLDRPCQKTVRALFKTRSLSSGVYTALDRFPTKYKQSTDSFSTVCQLLNWREICLTVDARSGSFRICSLTLE